MGGGFPGTATTFIVDEDFEGAGTPTGWANTTGTPDYDYATSPLVGAQSLYLATNGVAVRARVDFAAQSELWIYFKLKLTNGTLPSVNTPFISYHLGAGGAVAQVSINTARAFRIGSTSSVGTMSLNTVYHIWSHVAKGTGSDGVVDAAFSTDGVRPTSGNNFVGVVDGTNTTDVSRVNMGASSANMGMDIVIDSFRLAATQIGDNGT